MINSRTTLLLLSLILSFQITTHSQSPPPNLKNTTNSQILGYVNSKKLNEVSGIVASIQNPGYFWVHNDSGDEANLYLINSTGKHIATIKIDDATHHDWEDIAIGTPKKYGVPVLFIGDIGNNFSLRKTTIIYIIKEPKITENKTLIIEKSAPLLDTLKVRYSDEARDFETLLFDPISEQLFTVSKRKKIPELFIITKDNTESSSYTFEKTINLPLKNLKRRDNISGGDISKSGKRIAIKSYDYIYIWNRKNNESLIEFIKSPPQVIKPPFEKQSEAICWEMDQLSILTLSEKKTIFQ